MQENTSDQVAIGFSFVSDCWESGASFLDQPQHNKGKPMQSRIILDTQLKIALGEEEKIIEG